MAISAKVIADSSFGKTRLITLEIELHRFVLSEFLTHRTLSRNFQSSRAVPVEKMIEQVRNNPAMPVHWGKNQPGMVANEELDNTEHVIYYWKEAAKEAADSAEYMIRQGLHKQTANRLLEPFMWTRGVTTGTLDAWQAFLKLRNHKHAQPEIKALAIEIEEAIQGSKPVQLGEGDWHMPYHGGELQGGYWLNGCGIKLLDAIKTSASCCAQVSYRRLDDSLEKAEKVYEMLNLPKDGVYPEDPAHFSPTEHIAHAGFCDRWLSGNFQCNDFGQYRKMLEIGVESDYIE